MSSQTTATHRIRGSVGRRAALLADRIEEGAAVLAAFAEGLSEYGQFREQVPMLVPRLVKRAVTPPAAGVIVTTD